jgi:hypothetical protein
MLVALVRQILDSDIPSFFYLHTTFENIDYGVRKGQEEEEALVASLATKIVNGSKAVGAEGRSNE